MRRNDRIHPTTEITPIKFKLHFTCTPNQNKRGQYSKYNLNFKFQPSSVEIRAITPHPRGLHFTLVLLLFGPRIKEINKIRGLKISNALKQYLWDFIGLWPINF